MRKAILSTAEVASLFSVTETTVKRWADEGRLKCERTPGGHRKFKVAQVMDFSAQYGLTPSGTLGPGQYGEFPPNTDLAVLSRDFPGLANLYAEQALSDTSQDLGPFFSYMYQHQIQLWEIFDQVIQPGMKLIGDSWKNGLVSIGTEHRASQRTIEALSQLKLQMRRKQRHGGSALCACPHGTAHELGLRCASAVLEADGWNVHYLGANMPIDSITADFLRLHPSLVCLSISGFGLDRATTAALRELYRIVKKNGSTLVIGGSSASPDFFRTDECDTVLSSTRALQEFSKRTIRALFPGANGNGAEA